MYFTETGIRTVQGVVVTLNEVGELGMRHLWGGISAVRAGRDSRHDEGQNWGKRDRAGVGSPRRLQYDHISTLVGGSGGAAGSRAGGAYKPTNRGVLGLIDMGRGSWWQTNLALLLR